MAAASISDAASSCRNASCANSGMLMLQTRKHGRSALSDSLGGSLSRPYCGVAVNIYECGKAAEHVGESFASMCMGYGGTHPPAHDGKTREDRDMCTLNINNDCDHWYKESSSGQWRCAKNYGISKNPEDCHGQYLFLWDEPQTQGKDALWAATQWKAHVSKWSSQLSAARAQGLRVTSPAFTDHGGPARQKMQAFFGACSECNDPNSVYYIDVLAMNQWLLHDAIEHPTQEVWIKEETAAISIANGNRPVVLMNFAWLGAETADEQAEVIANSRIFDPSWSKLEAVFYFAATDYGGGTRNNFLNSVTSDGSTIGQALWQRCGEASSPSPPGPPPKVELDCDAACKRDGGSYSCRSRISWMMRQARSPSLQFTVNLINDECSYQCRCSENDFAAKTTSTLVSTTTTTLPSTTTTIRASSTTLAPATTLEPTTTTTRLSCNSRCRRHGHTGSCRNRVQWVLDQPWSQGLVKSLERVNAECRGQCHCAVSAFANSIDSTTTTTRPLPVVTTRKPSCESTCHRRGHGASCRNRVRWVLKQPWSQGLTQSLEMVNTECTGQCHCEADAFADSLTQAFA